MKLALAVSLAAAGALLADAAFAGVSTSSDGKIVTLDAPAAGSGPDYANAKPLPMPVNKKQLPPQWQIIRDAPSGGSGVPTLVSEGRDGDGTLTPETVPQSKYLPPNDGVSSQEYGASGQPYTTSRVVSPSSSPYRKAGKLFFKVGGDTFVCTASLIKPGIIVTAAHCVSEFGKRQYNTDFTYIPSYANGKAPFGTWTATSARVLTSYFNGTDSCTVSGIICANDVAVLTVTPKAGKYPGAQTGFFSFGINGYSFSSGQVLVTQLGYPVALDNGGLMERTDSQGSVVAAQSNNTVIGSLQTGGSSGGPWVANLGPAPKLATGTGFGKEAKHDVVVGVTSWGYNDTSSAGRKQQGASPFTAQNIQTLVNAACKATPAAC